MRIVLGSTSKWRHSIATKSLGMEIEMASADIDEKSVARNANPKTPADHVAVIASAKLDKIIHDMKEGDNKEDAIIMCYDTVVVHNNEILEKPKDEEDLIRMVKLWSQKGAKTYVFTAVVVGNLSTGKRLEKVVRAEMVMTRDLTEEEFNNYVADKYVRQSSGALIVENMQEINAVEITEGDLDIIQGFPVAQTKEFVNALLK